MDIDSNVYRTLLESTKAFTALIATTIEKLSRGTGVSLVGTMGGMPMPRKERQ